MLGEGRGWKCCFALFFFFLSPDAGECHLLPVPFPALLAKELQAGMNGNVGLRLGELPLQGTSRLEGWHCAKEGALLGTRSSAIPALAPGVGGNRSPHPLPCGARQPGGHPAHEEQGQTPLEPPKWLQQN